MDKIYKLVKSSGTKAHAAFIDRMALAHAQARGLGDDLISLLDGINGNEGINQTQAAVALLRMRLTPVVYIRLFFGRDNHKDAELMEQEVPEHIESIAVLGDLFARLKSEGIEDNVTVCLQNVFGRNLMKKGRTGRDHWGAHHGTILIGRNVNPGVYGGLMPQMGQYKEYVATPIDAQTGAAAPDGGDISRDDSLASVAKTVGVGLGLSGSTVNQLVRSGKIIQAAVKTA